MSGAPAAELAQTPRRHRCENMSARGDLRLTARAKINLYLHVVGRRPDGYHEVLTVLQTISLCDDLEFKLRTDGKLTLVCDDPRIPTDETNLIIKANG